MSKITMSSHVRERETRIQPLMLDLLEPDGTNFLEWRHDAYTYLCVEELDAALSSETVDDLCPSYRWQALLIIRRHIDASLRQQYVQVDDAVELWKLLDARFKHEETIFLPQAWSDWLNLRMLDFSNFASFNAKLHRISIQLKLYAQTVTWKRRRTSKQAHRRRRRRRSNIPTRLTVLMRLGRNRRGRKVSQP